ncbi:choice-of-anchor D domain-containing protein [Ottowia sp.]|uniref:choice-of-anchor D domain-containing protein n=1 Tax=Ottowia sp. TaxID=1898956 RepID=UPI002602ECFB|nr:choice-of-anchor D domain-containing protein [Ottowia sp.]
MSGLFSDIGMKTVWGLRSSRVRWGAVLGFVAALMLPSVALALPNFTIAPTTLNFGNVAVGVTSSGIDVVVTNVSGASQVLSSVAGGAPVDATNFGGVQSCAGITLAAGASCAFTYVFHPTTAGLLTSSASFSINGQAFSVSLRGGVPVVAPAGVTSVPTLGQWLLMLLSLLGAAMGALALGRGRAGVRR